MQTELQVIPAEVLPYLGITGGAAERIAAHKLKRVYLAKCRRKSNEKKGFIIL